MAEAKVAIRSEAEVKGAIEREFAIWLKAEAFPFNTGFNGRGGKNELMEKAEYVKVEAWWRGLDKVLAMATIKGVKVEYRTAVSMSGWDRKSPDVTLDFLCVPIGKGGGFNFHIVVKGYFAK